MTATKPAAVNAANPFPRSAPPRPPDLFRPRQAAKIKAAIRHLWPNGIPEWVSPARRDWEIQNWVWEKQEPIPSARTIRHVLRKLTR